MPEAESTSLMDLSERYRTLHDRIEAAAAKDGRTGGDVRLVAVTKFADDDQIRELLDLGHRDLGENRLQVMEAHAETVADWQDRHALIGAGEETVRWHFIGGLQRNKIKSVCRSCRLIHSVDNLRLAEEIDKASANLGRSEPMEVLIQVNVAGEKQKGGFPPGAEGPLIEVITEEYPDIRIRGLMCMAPFSENPEDARPVFEQAREMFETIRRQGTGGPSFDILSMGMTNDFEVAVECGSNLIRVGSALFPPPPEA